MHGATAIAARIVAVAEQTVAARRRVIRVRARTVGVAHVAGASVAIVGARSTGWGLWRRAGGAAASAGLGRIAFTRGGSANDAGVARRMLAQRTAAVALIRGTHDAVVRARRSRGRLRIGRAARACQANLRDVTLAGRRPAHRADTGGWIAASRARAGADVVALLADRAGIAVVTTVAGTHRLAIELAAPAAAREEARVSGRAGAVPKAIRTRRAYVGTALGIGRTPAMAAHAATAIATIHTGGAELAFRALVELRTARIALFSPFNDAITAVRRRSRGRGKRQVHQRQHGPKNYRSHHPAKVTWPTPAPRNHCRLRSTALAILDGVLRYPPKILPRSATLSRNTYHCFARLSNG